MVVANLLLSSLPWYGGHQTSKPEGDRSADRISRGFLPTSRENHFSCDLEKAGQVTISIGVIKVAPEESADQACIRADEALYKAKNGGKNRVVYL